MTVLVWLDATVATEWFSSASSLGAKHIGASRQVVSGATLGSVAGMAAKSPSAFTMPGIFYWLISGTDAKPPRHQLEMTVLMTPDMANFAGNVHGGTILKLLIR